MMETKWEKVDSNNMRKWLRDDGLTNKQALQDARSDYAFIANMSDTILRKLNIGDSSLVKQDAQREVDKLDALLGLLNNATIPTNIVFIDE
jgi:hypothetical protein